MKKNKNIKKLKINYYRNKNKRLSKRILYRKKVSYKKVIYF